MTNLERDYAYYTTEFAAKQAEQDKFYADFGLTRVDLAWDKALDRELTRNRPSWEAQKADFKADLERRQYAAAIGLALA
jgi:hypothetical protein